jgi:hypothetical protein
MWYHIEALANCFLCVACVEMHKMNAQYWCVRPFNPRKRILTGAIHPLPQYVFMAWCVAKHRDNFTFTFTLTLVLLVCTERCLANLIFILSLHLLRATSEHCVLFQSTRCSSKTEAMSFRMFCLKTISSLQLTAVCGICLSLSCGPQHDDDTIWTTGLWFPSGKGGVSMPPHPYRLWCPPAFMSSDPYLRGIPADTASWIPTPISCSS